MTDGMNGLDTAVLTWMVDHRTPWVTDVMTVVTTVGNTVGVAVLTVILAAIAWRRGSRRAALATLAVMLLGWGLMNGIKYAVRRTRPPTPERLVDLSTWSFPSGHAASADEHGDEDGTGTSGGATGRRDPEEVSER